MHAVKKKAASKVKESEKSVHPPVSQRLIENIYICMRITERDILYTGILSELSKIGDLPLA